MGGRKEGGRGRGDDRKEGGGGGGRVGTCAYKRGKPDVVRIGGRVERSR